MTLAGIKHSMVPRGTTYTPLDHLPPTTHLVLLAIRDQLPEGVRRRVGVEVQTDPYYLGTVATFITYRGDCYTMRLTSMSYRDKIVSARVPEPFVIHLCASL